MIRVVLLLAFALALCALSLRRWYWALCGLLFLTVLTQHPDVMGLSGIQGVNPWNVTFAFVVLGWILSGEQRGRRPHRWLGILLTLYVAMVVACGIAAVADLASLKKALRKLTFGGMLIEAIVNPLKYTMVGVLFYCGARSHERIRLGLFAAIGSSMCYAFLMFKTMGARVFTIDYEDARRLTDKLIGLFANDMAHLLAFTIWAAICFLWVIRSRWLKVGWGLAAFLIIPPFVALKSRGGFLACCCAGLALGILRWRWILVALPVSVGIVVMVAPDALERVMTGVGEGDEEGEEHDWNAISAGRTTNIWPPVIQQIRRSPIWGHGRFGILRTECFLEVLALERSVPSHPHNAYLEILLDAGVIGLGICLAWTCVIGHAAFRLMWCRGDKLLTALGGAAMAGIVGWSAAGVSGSSYFASQSSVPYYCVWAMAVGAYCDLKRRADSRRCPPHLRQAGVRQRPPLQEVVAR